MIHISKLGNITEKKDTRGEPVPFSFKAISLKGELIEGSNCIVTSSNFKSRTRNVKWLDSQQVRKLRNISFVEVNSTEITM